MQSLVKGLLATVLTSGILLSGFAVPAPCTNPRHQPAQFLLTETRQAESPMAAVRALRDSPKGSLAARISAFKPAWPRCAP